MGHADDLHAIVTRAAGTGDRDPRRVGVPRAGATARRLVQPDGGATLVVYLFHGFVVKGAEYAGLPGLGRATTPPVALGLTTALAVLLALFLAWTPVATRLDVLVDPLGHAEQHVHRTVELAVAKDQVAGVAPLRSTTPRTR